MNNLDLLDPVNQTENEGGMSIYAPENHEESLADVLDEQKHNKYTGANHTNFTEVLGEYEEHGRLIMISRDLENTLESVREGRDNEELDQRADNLEINNSMWGHRSSGSLGADDADSIKYPKYENGEVEDDESQQSQVSDFPSDQADNGSNYTQELPLNFLQSEREENAVQYFEEPHYFNYSFLDAFSNQEYNTFEPTHDSYESDSSDDEGNEGLHQTLSGQTLNEMLITSDSESDVDEDSLDEGRQRTFFSSESDGDDDTRDIRSEPDKENPDSNTDPFVHALLRHSLVRERGSRALSGNVSEGDDDTSDSQREQGEGSQNPNFESAPPYSTRNQRQASTQTSTQPPAQPSTQPSTTPTTTTTTITINATITITTTANPTPTPPTSTTR
ncbi:MAG: hypothetical protein Q9186_002264 [Xanthomendoza sp. 1 TL-2023]